jgi:hypothetical protein
MFVLAGIFMVASPALICTWYSISRLATGLNHPNRQMQPKPRNGAADLRRYPDTPRSASQDGSRP